MSFKEYQEDADAAACGVVRFVSPDGEEWHFESKDDPEVWWTVHLADWQLSGACSCPHFDLKIRPLLKAGVVRPHSPRSKCKHIRRAERVLCYKIKKKLFSPNNPPETKLSL